MDNKKQGVLMAVSSLPGRHGIGDFGKPCYSFIEWLKDNNYHYWQVLPLNPVGPGNSPYMSYSSRAIDWKYISLELLMKEGLLSKVKDFNKNATRVDYYNVGIYKKKILRIAYENFKLKKKIALLKKFLKEHEWVKFYATFEIFKRNNDNKAWNEWKEEDLNYYLINKDFPIKYLDDIFFEIFIQYYAFKQWFIVLNKAHQNGIKIICDMPFYVGFDGVECWVERNLFQIDNTNHLFELGGVGPDAFSKDGQLWGSPIYNFEKMKENKYEFLINRIGHACSLCDYLRIDHFRAFDTYYVIQASKPDAKIGEWKLGPSYEFFDLFYEKYPKAKIIAEDLGLVRPEVFTLRDHYHLPGMFIIQFTIFDEKMKSNDNMIVYSGTHDNETLYGWFKGLKKEEIKKLKTKINYRIGTPLFDQLVEYIYSLPSKITIFPLQDLLKLDNSARMNVPSTVSDKNWTWKLKDFNFVNEIKYPKKNKHYDF